MVTKGECQYKLPLPDRATFESYSADSKLMTLFDLLCIALDNQSEISRNLNRQKSVNIGISSGAGGITAGLVSLLEFLFKWR